MLHALLDNLSAFVTARRGIVLAVLGVVTLALGSQIPKLTADFTPSDLFAKFEDQERVIEAFRDTFGNTDNVMLVLIEADDVFEQGTLQYIHDLSRALDAEAFSARVDGLTLLPIPRQTSAVPAATDDARDSVFATLFYVGSAPARQIRHAVADCRDTSPPRPDFDLPDFVVMLAQPETSASLGVSPAIEGDTVTAEEAEALRAAVGDSPLLRGQLVSNDDTTTAVAIQLGRDVTRNDDIAAAVYTVEAFLTGHPPPDGVAVHLGGLPYLRTAVIDRMRADQSVMLPASIIVCILILLIAFRWLPAMILPTVAVVISAVMLVGGMAAVGEPFNILNNIIPLVVIIIGISNAIHLINRFGEELREGHERDEAARLAVLTMTVACFLTSFTTAVGFASLVVSRTEILRSFGITAAIGVMLAYVVTITFLPAALTMVRRPPPNSGAAQEGVFEDSVEAVTRLVMRHPWPVLGLTAVTLVASVLIGSTVVIDNRVLDQFSEQDEIYQNTRLIEDKLTGVRPLEVFLTSDEPGRFDDPEVLNAIDRVKRWALQQEGVIGALSYADFLREVRTAMSGDTSTRDRELQSRSQVELLRNLLTAGERNPVAPWVNDTRDNARLRVQLRDVGAQATIAFAAELQAELDRELGGFDHLEVRLTGDAYTSALGLDAVITDLAGSLLLAVVIIFSFMTLLFRSLRLGLLSIPPNITPLVFTLSYMALAGIPLNAATVIIFSVSIGLAVDGTIHVLARFREEAFGATDIDAALIRAARGTGKAIVLTGLSLMLGFGVMLLSSFPPVRNFGILIGVTVFGTLIATILVLPALLKVGARPIDAKRLAEDQT